MGLAPPFLQYRKLKEQGVSFTFDGEAIELVQNVEMKCPRLDEEISILSGSYSTFKNLGKDKADILCKYANRYYTKYCI